MNSVSPELQLKSGLRSFSINAQPASQRSFVTIDFKAVDHGAPDHGAVDHRAVEHGAPDHGAAQRARIVRIIRCDQSVTFFYAR